jgi:hypothetical protein
MVLSKKKEKPVKDKGKAVSVCAILLAGVFFLQPVQAFARGEGHGRDGGYGRGGSHHGGQVYHPYPAHGSVVVSLPHALFEIVLGGHRYYHSGGVFYERRATTYVVVSPPVGAMVAAIPAGYQVVIVNGATYYTADNVYYQYTPQGYMVVAPPVSPVVSVVSAVPFPVSAAEQSFTVYVPDSKSGYTAVAIKRSGNGFIGPQGEFYPEFPKVEQLRVMYSKAK